MTRPTPAPREQRGDCYWGHRSDGSPCTLPGHHHSASALAHTPVFEQARLVGEAAPQQDDEALIDPDCRDGKCASCMGGPCEHECHYAAFEVVGSLPGVDLVSLDGSHVHYYRQTVAGLVCSCGATVTT